ncbi:MAG: PLP-dependent transferase [Phycisphaerae bacterium]
MPREADGESSSGEPRAIRTRMIHGASRTRRWDYNHHVVPPISSSVTFRLDSAQRGARGFVDFGHLAPDGEPAGPIYIYDRLDEPTRGMLEENLAVAERGECAVCFATGMAAISAALGVLAQGGREIVAHQTLYGCTYSLLSNWLPRFGVSTTYVDLTDAAALGGAITPATRVVYFETPVNPDMRLIDIAAVRRAVDGLNASRAPGERIWIVVDNTFASPFCQRPLTLGADVVVESLTKSIGGFGTDMGGVVVGPRCLYDALVLYRKDFGGSLSPKAAWATLVYGLPSLGARMANYQKSAHHVARFLESHPRVAAVHYPGLTSFSQHALARRQMVDEHGRFSPGGLLYFELKHDGDDESAGERLVDWIAQNAYCITLAVSLGQIKTLIECPYTMTHAALPPERKAADGLTPGGIRLSVGLEDWHDLIADLREALAATATRPTATGGRGRPFQPAP